MILRLTIALTCLIRSNAFAPNAFAPRSVSKPQFATEKVDYDAPVESMVAVGNIVKTGEGNDILDHEIVVDDEEVVDFDPVRNPIQGKKIVSEATDFDAPLYKRKAVGDIVRSGEGGELDHDPIVDDECYMGKEGNLNDCVDFDPVK